VIAERSPGKNCVQKQDYTKEDFVAEVKHGKEFSSPAALLRITYHAYTITMFKTEKYTCPVVLP